VRYKLDLKHAYPCDKLTAFEREFIWEQLGQAEQSPHRLIISDYFQFEEMPGSLEEVFISSIEPVCIEAGQVQIGPIRMEFDALEWEYTVERHQQKSLDRKEFPFWRVVLNGVQLKPELRNEIRFTVGTSES
jgi:hypothetical protein